jgi:tetratricopeptide (TPR) repeat protein
MFVSDLTFRKSSKGYLSLIPNLKFSTSLSYPMRKCLYLILLVIPYIASCQHPKATNQQEEKISGREYYTKAISEYESGSYDSAIPLMNKALALIHKEDTLYSVILSARSAAYMNVGKLDSARKDLEQLIKIYPQEIGYLVNLSNIFGEEHRYTECLALLEKAKSIDDSNANIYMNLSYFSTESRAYDNAIKYAEKGLALTKDSILTGSILNNLGFAQSRAISVAKGLQTVNRSIKFFPENSYAYFNRGRILLDMNAMEEACSDFIKARDLGGVVLTEEYIAKYCK